MLKYSQEIPHPVSRTHPLPTPNTGANFGLLVSSTISSLKNRKSKYVGLHLLFWLNGTLKTKHETGKNESIIQSKKQSSPATRHGGAWGD
jgi:hypothetical protein